MADNGDPGFHPGVGDALREAAVGAMRAPSVLNTQPWRWRVRGDALDLQAERSRQITSIDPLGRLLTLSCGAALHHARVILAAHGHEPVVTRLPEPAQPGLLARIEVAGPHAAGPGDVALAAAIRRRRSDRRPFVARRALDHSEIRALDLAAAAEGTRLHRVAPGQCHVLDEATRRAQATEAANASYQRDLRAWTDDRPSGAGVPCHTLVATSARPVSLRDFAGGGETGLDPGLGDDRFADYLIVATDSDEPLDWLRAGEATSAVWLTATASGLAASALSDVVEVDQARALVASLLPCPGHPQLVLRVGVDAQPTPPPASPRLRADDVIDIEPRDR